MREPVASLAARRGLRLAVVSSSALARLAVCFAATGLDDLFPAGARFSAEDSPPVPTSKPDPAIYALAAQRLGLAPEDITFVDDLRGNLKPARALGMATVHHVDAATTVAELERLLGRELRAPA